MAGTTVGINQFSEAPVLPPPKACKKCGLDNRKYSTRLNGKGKRYYNLTCITCRDNVRRATRRAKFRAMSPGEAYRIRRHEQLRRVYKISIDEYDEMVVVQKGLCKICQTKPNILHVDHCHETKKIRGLLCSLCNMALGKFKDNEKSLTRAISYLRGEL